jgi:hypothetical protein
MTSPAAWHLIPDARSIGLTPDEPWPPSLHDIEACAV